MPVSNVAIIAPADALLLPIAIVRPAITVNWTNSTNTKQVDYTWDDDPTFGNGNGNRQARTFTGVSGTQHTGAPSADLGDTTPGTTWHLRAVVTDEVDAAFATDNNNTFVYDADPITEHRFLYLLGNVGVAFDPIDAPAGGWGSGIGGTEAVDGFAIDFNRYFYLLGNVGVGFEPTDRPVAGWGVGGVVGPDGHTRDSFDRFLYQLANVEDTQPCPFIFQLAPNIAREGESLQVRGQGLVGATDPTADPYGAEVRLYETADLGGTFTLLPITTWTAGETEDVIEVTVPPGTSSGFVAVVHTATATCDGSNFRFLTVLAAAGFDSGWWIEAWTTDLTSKIVDPVPVVRASYEDVLNEIGQGRIELSNEYGHIVDLICDAEADPPVTRLLKVFHDGVEAYSFYSHRTVIPHAEDSVVAVVGPGREQPLEWTLALPDDFPAQPSTAGEHVYGSTENLVVNGGAERDDLTNPFPNAGHETGDENGWDPYPDGEPNTIRAADGSVFRTGSWSLKVLPTAAGTGAVAQLIGPSGAPIQNQVICEVWVRAFTGAPTIQARAFWVDSGPAEVTLDTASVTGTSTWQRIILRFFVPTDSPIIHVAVTNQSGTEPFHVDDEHGVFSTEPWIPYAGGDQFHIDDTHSPEGDYSFKVVPAVQNGGFGQVVGTLPNETHRVTAAVVGTAGQTIRLSAQAADGFPSADVELTGGVDVVSLEFVTAAGEETVRIWLRNMTAATPFWADDIIITPGEPAGSAGTVMGDLFDAGQTRGALAGWQRTFTDTLDSNGEAWDDNALAISFPFGETLKQVLDRLVGLGAEWQVTNSLFLHLANRVGVDLTVLADCPVLHTGPAIHEGTERTLQVPSATFVFVAGKDGVWTTAANPAAETHLLRREKFVSNLTVPAGPTLAKYGLAALAEEDARKLSFSVTLTRNDEIRPYRDFQIGDTIWVNIFDRYGKSNRQAYRIRGLRVTLEGEDDISYEVIVNHVALEAVAAQAVALQRLLARGNLTHLSLGRGVIGTT